MLKFLNAKTIFIGLFIILIVVCGFLFQLTSTQSKSIKSLQTQLAEKDKTILTIKESLDKQIDKFNELNKDYSKVSEEYKNRINQLLLEKHNNEEILKDTAGYTDRINNEFNMLLSELSKSTGNRGTNGTSK